jgi:predicted ATPase
MWQQTVAGSGQIGIISGEPGIGKSRLIRQFRSELNAPPRDILSLQCSPFHVNTPLAPEIERLRSATGIQETDDAELALAKLRSLLAREAPDLAYALRYYGAILSIPACSDYEPVDLGSPIERDRAFQAFIDVLVAASRKRPILIVAEDVQWVDPTSIDLVLRIIARCSSERVMILITHRDDYQPDWLSGPAVRPIVLQKLAPHECEQIVAAVAGSDVVPRRITSQIVERTDGIPLFVEEYTRAVIDSRAIERTDDDLALSNKLSEPLVPSSIHDSLMERLDRLGPAKRVAQIASVFGRQFTYDGILNVLPGKGELLKHALQALESAGIVYRIEEPQGAFFRFKPAMIQDAAYSSLLKEERRELHARRIVAASGGRDQGEQPARRARLSLCAGRQHSRGDRGMASGRQVRATSFGHQGGRGSSSRGPLADSEAARFPTALRSRNRPAIQSGDGVHCQRGMVRSARLRIL